MAPKKAFFIMLGALGLIVVLTTVGVYFGDRYLAKQAEVISDLKADDELQSTALINAQVTQEQLRKYGYIDLIAEEVLPGAKNQSEVLLIINEIGTAAGVDVDNYSFASTDGEPGDFTQTEPLEGASAILVFPINVRFEATYSQILTWLKLAEQNQRKMQVESISISPPSEDNNKYGVTVILNAFVGK